MYELILYIYKIYILKKKIYIYILDSSLTSRIPAVFPNAWRHLSQEAGPPRQTHHVFLALTCVFVCVCVCKREREKKGRKDGRKEGRVEGEIINKPVK